METLPQSQAEQFLGSLVVSVMLYPVPFAIGALFFKGPFFALLILLLGYLQGAVVMMVWCSTFGAIVIWLFRHFALKPAWLVVLSCAAGGFVGLAISLLQAYYGQVVSGGWAVIPLGAYVGFLGGISPILARRYPFR